MKNFTSKTQKIGELGENIACVFLMKHNFIILERNYTRKWGEIDIIAEKDSKIHFIEVKSKSVSKISDYDKNLKNFTEETFKPEENLHFWKMQRLRKTVETYLINKRIGNKQWQFDLLIVYLDLEKRISRVKTIKNIVL